MSKYPKQKQGIKPNSNPEQNRAAIAPYNFVALPDQVIAAQDANEQQQVCIEEDKKDKECKRHPALVRHDCYFPDRHTGYITGKLIADSPIYTRTGLSPEDFAVLVSTPFHEMTDEQKERYAKFFALQGTPTIPGSSLRGMFRMLVEIVSHAKMTRVQKEPLVYRAVGDTSSLGESYREDFLYEEPDGVRYFSPIVRAGFMHKTDSSWQIKPAKTIGTGEYAYTYSRIEFKKTDLVPKKLPKWKTSITNAWKIWVTVRNPTWHKHAIKSRRTVHLWYAKVQQAMSSQPKTGHPEAQEGVLVKTGHMNNKHLHFVFNMPIEDANSFIDIPKDIEMAYRNQLTEKQKEILNHKDGVFQEGQPVFYLLRDDKLLFLGHAQNFRLPYPHSPHDFVPNELQDPTITDLAEALFGYVPDAKDAKDTRQAYAGRVFFEDAPLVANNSNVTNNMHPRILSSPKPTTFQHYLVQTEDERHKLNHYASKPGKETVIRGHKLYWHQECARIKDTSNNVSTSSQHTGIQPLDVGATFAMKIHFENLSDVELGVLLWIMQIAGDEAYRLKLGMGKPLGMGTIRIQETTVVCSHREQRYSKLFAPAGQWETGEEPMGEDKQDACIKAFEKHVKYHYQCDPEVAFEKLPRIHMLLSLLSYPGPAHDQTRYMEIERDTAKGYISGKPRNDNKVNEYANRPVLPCPLDVLGEQSQAECEMIEPSHPQPQDNAQQERTIIETRMRGKIETEATSQRPGELYDEQENPYLYHLADVIEEKPVAGQTVLFHTENRKIPSNQGERLVPFAINIEVYRE